MAEDEVTIGPADTQRRGYWLPLTLCGLLLTVVRSEGITALVATHDEALIDLADEVLRLEDGRVQAGGPARLDPGRRPAGQPDGTLAQDPLGQG